MGKAPLVEGDDEKTGKAAGVARIVLQDDERLTHVGMGVIVGPRHMLTCCHVLNDAMRRPDRLDPARPEESVSFQIRFPYASGESRSGCVVEWGLSREPKLDAAILRLTEDAPKAVGISRFTKADVEGREWQCVGADVNGKLLWPKGKIGPEVPGNRVQLDGPDAGPRPTIQPGYSGGGVWCPDKRALVGIVVSVDRDKSENGVAFAIPTRSLLTMWRLPLVLSTVILVAIAVAASLPVGAVIYYFLPTTRMCCSTATAAPSVDVSALRPPPPKVVLRNCSTEEYADGDLKLASGAELPLTGSKSMGGVSAGSPPGTYVIWGLRVTPRDRVLQSAPSTGATVFAWESSVERAMMQTPEGSKCGWPPSMTLKTANASLSIDQPRGEEVISRCESTVAAVEAFQAEVPDRTLAVREGGKMKVWIVSRNATEQFGPFAGICFYIEGQPMACRQRPADIVLGPPVEFGERTKILVCRR